MAAICNVILCVCVFDPPRPSRLLLFCEEPSSSFLLVENVLFACLGIGEEGGKGQRRHRRKEDVCEYSENRLKRGHEVGGASLVGE